MQLTFSIPEWNGETPVRAPNFIKLPKPTKLEKAESAICRNFTRKLNKSLLSFSSTHTKPTAPSLTLTLCFMLLTGADFYRVCFVLKRDHGVVSPVCPGTGRDADFFFFSDWKMWPNGNRTVWSYGEAGKTCWTKVRTWFNFHFHSFILEISTWRDLSSLIRVYYVVPVWK